jgi:hypothetical protein
LVFPNLSSLGAEIVGHGFTGAEQAKRLGFIAQGAGMAKRFQEFGWVLETTEGGIGEGQVQQGTGTVLFQALGPAIGSKVPGCAA